MKRVLFIVSVIGIYLSFGKVSEATNLIPTEAIRIRVLANSNTTYDQQEKIKVKENLENYLYDVLKDVEDIKIADQLIQKNIPALKEIIEMTYEGDYTVNYGMNYFPKKEYKGILYEEGYYNSLVVNLGNGLGENWWCILFPPLCMLEGNIMDDVEYRSLVGDIIDKYF